MRWMHRIRLYPTESQEARLRHMLHVTRHLYNAALQERRDAYRGRGISVTAKMQYAELTALRAEDPGLASIYRECEDAVLHRLELGIAAFFRRIKSGQTPGYPRFKPASRWRQLEFPHGDRAIRFNEAQTQVRIPQVGRVKLRKGRAVPEFGRAFVVEKNGRWYAVFECERDVNPLVKTGQTVGVDRGAHVLAALSDGTLVANRKVAERQRRLVTGHQRALEAVTIRGVQGHCLNRTDAKRQAAIRRLARAKEREANARLDHAHKVALKLIRENDVIGMESLNLRAMTRSAKGTVEKPGRNVAAKSGLNRVVLDAGFGILRRLLGEKAEHAARRIVDVDARYSSQTCGRCLHVSSKSRRRRRFCCVACGWTSHADVAAALEIRRRAKLWLTSVSPSGSTRLRSQDTA
jgi:putative transposase